LAAPRTDPIPTLYIRKTDRERKPLREDVTTILTTLFICLCMTCMMTS